MKVTQKQISLAQTIKDLMPEEEILKATEFISLGLEMPDMMNKKPAFGVRKIEEHGELFVCLLMAMADESELVNAELGSSDLFQIEK